MNFGIAQRPKQGELVCGDRYLVIPGAERTLVMVADGAGHGERAAEASARAAAYVEAHAEQGLEQILRGCSEVMTDTRGAAVALLRLDFLAKEVSFASVGNVEIQTLCRLRATAVCSPGILGRPVRKILTFTFPLNVGDRIALFSDGISRRFRLRAYKHLSVQQAAEKILSEFSVFYDDATCVVGEYLPRGSIAPMDTETELRLEPEPEMLPTDVEVSITADVIRAGVAAQRLAAQIGFDRRSQYEAAVVTQELASNIVKYAKSGRLRLRPLAGPRAGLEIHAEDCGPGIDDLDGALRDSISQGRSWLELPTYHQRPRGLGMGLGTVKRLMDEVVLENGQSGGLRVLCLKYL